MALPPHPQPVWPTEEVIAALEGPHDFTQFKTWKDLFQVALKENNRHLYITQFFKGCPVSRYEVAMVAAEETSECPVVLFSAGGLFGDDAGNLGGSVILKFFPPIQRQIIETYQFGNPEIK